MRQRKAKMVEEEWELVPFDFEELAEPTAAYFDPTIFDDDKMDEDYKCFLLKYYEAGLNKKRREKDEEEDDNRYYEVVNDPDPDPDPDPGFELFLKYLKPYDQSYMLEIGSTDPIIYEEKSNSDKEWDLEPRRKLRSAAKQINCLENQCRHDSQSTPTETIVKLPKRRLRNKSKSEEGKNVKLSTQIMLLEGEGDSLCIENQRKHDSKSKAIVKLPQGQLSNKSKSGEGKSVKLSNQIMLLDGVGDSLCLENQRKHFSKSKVIVKLPEEQLSNKSKSEKGKNVKLSIQNMSWEGEVEGDYLTWLQGVEVFDNDCVYSGGGYIVEYEKKEGHCDLVEEEYSNKSSSDMEFLHCNLAKEEYSDGSSSDVEFLGSTFNKEENPDYSTIVRGSALDMNDVARFRQKIIAALRKPYDQLEYDRLLQEIEYRRPEARHLDLRHGRERSYSVKKEGKSYLDYYPDFERKLLQVVNDKPRRLNLLRGFFIWLKQPGRLLPWKDAECLSIDPVRAKPSSYHGLGLARS